MKWLVEYFVNRSFTVNLVAGFMCVVGLYTIFTIKRDVLPPLEFQSIEIEVRLPGASPVDIEKWITFPIEDSLRGLPGVEEMTSNSRVGRTDIILKYFLDYPDIEESLELVRSRVDGLRANLPTSIERIEIARRKIDSILLMAVNIIGIDEKSSDHRRIVKRLERRIGGVRGVARVDNRMQPRHIYVRFNKEAVDNAELSVANIKSVIFEKLRFTSIGEFRTDEESISINLDDGIKSLDDFEDLSIATNTIGNELKLGQVAHVEYDLPDDRYIRLRDGQPAVTLRVRKDLASDALKLQRQVEGVLENFNDEVKSEKISAEISFDTPRFIKQQLDVMKSNGLFGLMLVLIILIIFLSPRVALMTTLGLPIAYLGAIALLPLFGISIDLLSMIGLILVLGILVDDAIIVSEKYTSNLEEGMAPKKAAVDAVVSLIIPVTGTVLTTIIAFSPIILLKNEISNMLFALPVVVILTLIFSWLESFFVLPNHLSHFVKQYKKAPIDNLFSKFQKLYKRLLTFMLGYRYLLLLFLTGLFVFTLHYTNDRVKKRFRLNIGPEQINVYAVFKENKSLRSTQEDLDPVHEALKPFLDKGIEAMSTTIGGMWADGRWRRGTRYSVIRLRVDKNITNPSRIKKQVLEEVKPILAGLKHDNMERLAAEAIRWGQEEDKQDIVSVKVRGNERLDFHSLEQSIVAIGTNVEGIERFVDDPDRYQKEWKFSPDNRRLARYEMSRGDVTGQIRPYLSMDLIGYIRMDGETTEIYSELANIEEPEDIRELEDFTIKSSKGISIPLNLIGNWVNTRTLQQIRHMSGERELIVDFKVDRNVATPEQVMSRLDGALEDFISKNRDYEFAVEFGDEQEKKNREWAMKVVFYCMVGILVVLALILGSLTQPLLVILPAPFALVGVLWALYFHDLDMGLLAMIGFIGTVGVAVNDSLIMVDKINKITDGGKIRKRSLIIEGATSRLRAVILTTITTVGGILPMAYGIGGESGFTGPLAFSLGWGLMFATTLTLFALPALLCIRNDIINLGLKILRKDR